MNALKLVRLIGVASVFGACATTAPAGTPQLAPRPITAASSRAATGSERKPNGPVEPVRHRTFKLPPDAEERWRTALDHYVPLVTHDRMRKLNGAAVHFANLIVGMHNRIHPIFTDTFLASLADLPASDPMNEATLFTTLEIVLSGETGRLLRLGVVKSSGLTAFDVAALESTTRAQPFGPPPPETLSDDGNVYLQWQFHRDVEACGTANVHPFLLEFKPDANSPSSSDPSSPSVSAH